MRSVTIKDIANYAEVSTATVSRVLNKNYYVSPELTNRVLNLVKKYNYYPNSIARSLKTRATYTIALVFSNITNTFFTVLTREIERIIFNKKYNLIVCTTEGKKGEEKKILELLLSKKIDGLIINTMAENDEFICEISKKIPTILINRKIKNPLFQGDFIGTECISGAYMLTKYLLENNHRKIGVINGSLNISTGKERFEGFKRAMKDYDILINDNYIYRYNGNFTTLSGYKGMVRLMNSSPLPTAIVVMNNNMLIGALKYCKKHKVKIPKNISICSFGNVNNIDLMYIRPTIVKEDPGIIGTKIGNFILERIEKNNFLPNREIVYQPKLLIGNTVYCRKNIK